MPISGNVPQHLVVGARAGFLTALKTVTLPWQRVANVINATARTTDLVDLGATPMPVEGTPVIQDFVERSLQVKARDWSTVIGISYNAIKDDQTATVEPKARSAGERFQRHINGLVFKGLNAGDGTTYGLAYDGLSFFNDAHVDKGASYVTAQDNNLATVLSLDNFTSAINAAAIFVDDKGEYTEHIYDLLIVPPALRRTAAQICGNPDDYGTANRAVNPFSGKVDYIVVPQFDATGWELLCTNETQKPILFVQREAPALQDAWFDAMGPDGGMYYFKYYARYNLAYGDWRQAILGNS